jgi:glycosyltransferase involved in cell wall biosynthesis
MTLALFIPTFNEEKHIESFLASLLEQDIFDLNYELKIRFYDGCSNDNTVEKITKYMKNQNISFKVIENKQRYVAFGFNKFLTELNSGYLIRMDAHQEYPRNYLSKLVKLSEEIPEFGCIGPRIKMAPSDSSLISRSICSVLNSKIGVGGSTFRTKEKFKGLLDVDTVPFGIWKVKTLKKFGGMNLKLNRNQDDDLNRRLRDKGNRIILVGGLEVICFPRDSLQKHFLMFYQYGLYKPEAKGGVKKMLLSKQILPSAFLTIIAIMTIFLGPKVFFIVALIYFMLGFFIKRDLEQPYAIKMFILNSFVLLLTHTAYGLGVMKGIVPVLFDSKEDCKL